MRSGVGLESVATVEGVVGIERMWAIGATIFVSFANSTAQLPLDPEITQSTGLPSDFTDEPTLALDMVHAGVVQIVPSGILIWSHNEKGQVTPTSKIERSIGADDGNEVVAGAIARNTIVTAKRDGSVDVFNSGSRGIKNIKSGKITQGVAAIALHIQDEVNGNIDVDGKSAGIVLIAVADWTGEIGLYYLNNLDPQDSKPVVSTREQAFASSLMFQETEDGQQRLVAGLSDGTLVTYDLNLALSTNFRKGRTASSLGLRPLLVTPLQYKSDKFEEQVVAAGISDRLSVVFESRGHLEFSASGKKVSYVKGSS